MNLRYWILAFRPKTLTAAVVPIAVATAFVVGRQPGSPMNTPGTAVQWWISGFALLASLCIQIGTNLVNDAVDFKKGADNDERLGPQRVTQSGIFTSQAVMAVAAAFFILAACFGTPLVLHGGWTIVIIGILAIAMGYAYTAGPFPLAYLGLGDLFVILFFGLVAVGGMVFLHLGSWPLSALVLGLQIGLHCAVLIAINNLRDTEGDRKVGKKTLPVRWGKTFARYEIAALVFAPFILGLFWWQAGMKGAALMPLVILPFAFQLVKLVFMTEPSRVYNEFLGKAAALHLGFGVLLSLGILL